MWWTGFFGESIYKRYRQVTNQITGACYTPNTFTAIFSSYHSVSTQFNHKQVIENSWYKALTTKQCSSLLIHLSEGKEVTWWRRLSSYVRWAPLSWRYMYVHYNVYTTMEPWLSKLCLSKPSIIQTPQRLISNIIHNLQARCQISASIVASTTCYMLVAF